MVQEGTKKQQEKELETPAAVNDDYGTTDSETLDRPQAVKDTAPETAREPLPIIAIGASAGGLKVLQQLFDRMPSDSGCAFVVVMHLSPEHESHLERLLQPHTDMPVQQVTETVPLEKNQVYLIPPNANLNAIDTHLRLTQLEPRSRRAPIDHFFRSLPRAHDGNLVGILLSGSGSDGTLGLRNIQELNGMTIVQDPAEAEFSGMPQSAIAAAAVDSVLPLADIPVAVMHFVKTKPQVEQAPEDAEADKPTRRFLQKVFAIVRARTGRDYTYYKGTTMLRRTLRRMQFNHLDKPDDYLDLMRSRPEEIKALADDLLITVTSFFRDPDVFDVLGKSIVPELFAGKKIGDTIRVWSVGCATGEEAYSLAMLLLEEAERHDTPPAIQIFASDLHKESLDKAREGFYPGDIEDVIGEPRLKRFFHRENGCYRIRKEVRELVVFAPHNLLADPPFSRIDLITCRNLLIYLERSLQQQVAELFHYALQEGAYLVLGTSENAGGAELFQSEDKKHMIYRKRKVPGPAVRLPVFPLIRAPQSADTSPTEAARPEPASYGTLHQYIVEQYGPPSVLLSPEDNIVHSSAQAGRYLLHPGGLPSTNIFKLVREELRLELRTSLSRVRKDGRVIRTQPVPTRIDGEEVVVELDLRPAAKPDHEGFILLVFDERPRPEAVQLPPASTETGAQEAGDHDGARVRELETEKALLEERLHQLIEEHESSQEEIRAANEELQSSNEELRSTLEELETSREELQSTNEELQTLNQENRYKVEELNQLSGDLQNLLVATDIATLFLDRHNKIVRFTPKIEQLFNIQSTDRGRALSDFTSHLGYDELAADIARVLERLVPIDREVRDKNGSWYLARVLPYRDLQDRIAGTVVTFVDITDLKEAAETTRRAQQTSEAIIERLPVPLLVLTPELTVHSANAAFLHHFKVEAEVTLGHKIYDLGNGQWDIARLRTLFEQLLPQQGEFTDYEVEHEFERLGRRVMALDARRLESMNLILLGIHDVTDRRLAEEEQRQAARRKDEYLAMLGHELRNPLGAIRNATEILRRSDSGDERQRRTVGVLYRQTAHIARIIDGLLDVSRIGRGKISLNCHPVDIRRVLESALETRNADVSARGLELTTEIAREPLQVMGDEVRLIQVFDNLLANAIKFTQPPGTITVTVAREGQDALVRIRDTGEGIESELLSSIFESFEQGRQDVARTSGGLGLGLSLAKGLVTLHNGSIEAHSEGPGTGSAFVIRLPITAASEKEAAAEEPEGIEPQMILVVEDNRDASLMIRELLEDYGHQVSVAGNGQEALEMLERQRADVVLCDLGLPGMSGYEFARTIRKNTDLRELPLVAVTGYGQMKDRDRALAAGFSEHLTKPVDLKALNAVLRGIL